MENVDSFDIIISIRDNEVYMPRSEYQLMYGKFIPSYSPQFSPADYLTSRDWRWIRGYIDGLYENASDEEILALNEKLRAEYLEALSDMNRFCSRAKATPKKRKTRRGIVYVLNAGPYYKIGRTTNLDNRIAQLSTLPPFDLEIIHTIETDNAPQLEAELHNALADKHKNGEWFELDEEDVTWLKTL